MIFSFPTEDASTVPGQLQWFMCGYMYSAVIASVGLMIKIFRLPGKDGTDI